MNYWPSVKSKKPIIQREFRGVNKLDSFSIGDSYATESTNLTSSKYPAISTRSGFSLLGDLGDYVYGMGAWKDIELSAIVNGVWYKYSGGSWSVAFGGFVSWTVDASFANFKGGFADMNLIMANGAGQLYKYDGATVSILATSPNGGNYVEQFADRLWCAVGNDLKYTAYRVGDDWTTINGDDADSGFITVETSNGETINSVKAGLSAMTVFKPSSINKLMGYAPSDYTLITVTREIGVLNNKCAVTIQGVMYILDDTGIYQYYGSTLPDKSFSEVVQYYIDNMNKTNVNACSLTSDGRYLYASIPMLGATPDTTLVYDTQFKIWNVHTNINATCGVKMGNALYLGDSAGKVITAGGTADYGTPIAFKWVSKPFGSGSMNQRIRWYRLWLLVSVEPGAMVTVYVSKSATGDSDWTSVQTITGTLQSVRMPVNLGALAMGNWLRIKFEGLGPVTIYEFDREQEEMPLL